VLTISNRSEDSWLLDHKFGVWINMSNKWN
jgi:hypothetical protein